MWMIIRFILQDYTSPYSILADKINLTSLYNRRIQNFLVLLYKSLFFANYPSYMRNVFTLRSTTYIVYAITTFCHFLGRELPHMNYNLFHTSQQNSGTLFQTLSEPVIF